MVLYMISKFNFSKEVAEVLSTAKGIIIPKTKQEILDLVFGAPKANEFNVSYEVNGKNIVEASVVRCKNAVVVNMPEDSMRKRDPDCLVVADKLPTDKPRFSDVWGMDFSKVRHETFEWLKSQELIVLPYMAGGEKYGYPSVMIAPRNAAFFAYATATLQKFVNIDEYKGKFTPRSVIFVAPPFRHTHFKGKQCVVCNRMNDMFELFSYNLYPGPSAKKGVYSFLIDIGEREGWVTAHASAVKVITPYDNELVIMHEGASGGGKSELSENIHRDADGRIVVGQNLETMEKFYIDLHETCQVLPAIDDMAICNNRIQNQSSKLVVADGEDGWFFRVDNIKQYGTQPALEKLCIHTKDPLVFLNIQGKVGTTSLIWEHTLDSNGQPCSNPRVILPREMVENIISEPLEVDVRSFGVRMPPCSKAKPDYGIMGMLHVIPPALAWLWRLVAPRGYNNPSITTSNKIQSEGVGSYWPFATGKKVRQANLLLAQILNSPRTRYVLIPNQHIGFYRVGFMPEWLSREYIARRGGIRFKPEQLVPARCPLLGFCLDSMKIDGQFIRRAFLRPETQVEVGLDGYDKGAKILTDFFKSELKQFLTSELDPLGKKIIECFLNDGVLDDFMGLIPMKY